jgi:Histidine kinase-, DNA gyrase B-, and HSP90-like ATPase
MSNKPLVLRFGGALVEQLGAQLYPTATATVAELISNAWDADASNVWVSVPLGEAWTPDSEIVVIDDGIGMTRDDAQSAYLVVGRRRRVELKTDESPGGRKVHGRKGIGKLAAFGTARILECLTVRDGTETRFRLDYDAIRALAPNEDYEVEPSQDSGPLTSPADSSVLEHGTRVHLSHLKLKRALSHDQFMRSMARRFAISSDQMRIWINGEPLERFDVPVQIRFPRDGSPDGVELMVDEAGWGQETLPSGNALKWWIGFTEKPIDDESVQGISILARGKMAQRPFKFERSQGVEGQLGQEYLVGEVQADWVDAGADIDEDLIQSNRDQLQLEDERLDELLEWGKSRLAWALRRRVVLRRDEALEQFEVSEDIADLLKDFTSGEQRRFKNIARTASGLPEMDGPALLTLMQQVVDAHSDTTVRALMEEIEKEDESLQARMWFLVKEFGLIDARRTLSIIEARLATISKLRTAIESGAKEVPEIHTYIREDPWLLDPRWQLLDDEVDPQDLGISYAPELDEDGQQLDFLFVLQPAPPARIDEVVVVEIKRGTNKDGSERRATVDEVDKFSDYVLAAQNHYEKSTDRPIVRGLMIAQNYTGTADMKRKTLEQVAVPRFEFRTWARVIEETERMHVGWLQVSKRRIEAGRSEEGRGDAAQTD